MEIRHKLYPHPVLWEDTDDYINSKFNVDVKFASAGDKYNFTITFDLVNAELEKMIEEEKVEYLVHVECPLTGYREIITSNSNICVIGIESRNLLNKLFICSFLVVKDKIEGYSNTNFNPDYEGITFDLNKAVILAIAEQKVFNIQKKTNNSSATSIFTLVKDLDAKQARIDLGGDKIIIALNENDYTQYSQNKFNSKIVNSFIIFPTLVYALSSAKTNLEDMNESSPLWFETIKERLEKHFNKNLQDIFEESTEFELAQIIMQQPIELSFKALDDLNDMLVEED